MLVCFYHTSVSHNVLSKCYQERGKTYMYMKNYFVKYLIFFKKLIHQLYLDAVDTLSWSRCGWNAQY